MMYNINNLKICIIGLGYVGLPLALEFGKKYHTIGFDINKTRIEQLKDNIDITKETDQQDFIDSKNITFSSNKNEITEANFYIVTVPTPVDEHNIPDISIVRKASELVGSVLNKNDIVVFESTVYPGATEEVSVPALEQESNLIFNKDFHVGYSPERINPGDKKNRLPTIIKITSGSTPETADYIDKVYQEIIIAGTHKAPSIKVAEAAKVIENTQRDVSIALINELSMIFDRLDINTKEVIEAASTKWNFQKLLPGLVGGHCIGVDPYYLAHKAESLGLYPDLILTSRRLNENMVSFVSNKLTKAMNNKKIHVVDSDILILGFTFKENCPDIRNTQVVKLYKEIKHHNANVDIYDPEACTDEILREYNINALSSFPNKKYDAVIVAVAHDEFKNYSHEKLTLVKKENSIIMDLKGCIIKDIVDCYL
ncbi:nucleotide sugar dehydrogenase [uncultured Shewanella sp.]|uniref:nucleotide sugar dehydrogenase n=1 Tax=uncultured Shewanella sp. TaxID=173975 RepID=UPI002635B943|nr:nucleotide sugar dehydrogenase [uncultured Shewanella sp.]